MNAEKRINIIKNWILSYTESTGTNLETLVVGVSGGIDSSVVSAICAKTGINTIAASMPIKQKNSQHSLSIQHQDWLKRNFKNIECPIINLDNVFKNFQNDLSNYSSEIGFANSRSRIRMATLYQIAKSKNGIVVGTGNKVEDFGVGFYTKYGDGGVDISPIADCSKSEVWELGKELGILKEIIDAPPTDGLWDDGRTDEGQLGFKYSELEDAMDNPNSPHREQYEKIRNQNLHKMEPIPVCKIPS